MVLENEKNEMLSQAEESDGAVTTDNGRYRIHALTIVGQIEGHYALTSENKTTQYEHVIPQLVAAEESPDVEGLLVLLNTIGGDIEAGLALAELIAGMKTPTVSLVLGGGHSIGVPLAVAAKRSLIVPSATMTLHPVRTTGLVLGVSQSFAFFQKMQARITRFVTEHSHITENDFLRLSQNTDALTTDMGTVLEGEEAVALGLIDEVGSLSAALAALYEQIERQRKGE